MQKFKVFYNLFSGETVGSDQNVVVEATSPENARNIVKRNYAIPGMGINVRKIKKVKC